MPVTLDQRDKGFEAAFIAFLATKREVSEDVGKTVREIIAAVRARSESVV